MIFLFSGKTFKEVKAPNLTLQSPFIRLMQFVGHTAKELLNTPPPYGVCFPDTGYLSHPQLNCWNLYLLIALSFSIPELLPFTVLNSKFAFPFNIVVHINNIFISLSFSIYAFAFCRDVTNMYIHNSCPIIYLAYLGSNFTEVMVASPTLSTSFPRVSRFAGHLVPIILCKYVPVIAVFNYSATCLYGMVRGHHNCTLYPEKPNKQVTTVTMKLPAHENTTK